MYRRFLPAKVRIAQLARDLDEAGGPTGEQTFLAWKHFCETGELPRDPELAGVCERASAHLAAMEETVPYVEP